jgi:hypothetical protein
VTVEVDNKSLYNLLPSEMNAQPIRPQFLPQDFLGGSHLAAEFFCALKFLRGDFLIRDDVFDGHGMILLKNPSPVSPKGEKLKPPKHGTLALTNVRASGQDKSLAHALPSRSVPEVKRRGSGKGQLNTANHYANRGKVPPSPPSPLCF